jgi:hypothetical protein
VLAANARCIPKNPRGGRRAMTRVAPVDNTAPTAMSTITDMIVRGWDNFLARPAGSLNLRFILQPTVASILALRAGIRDARAKRPAYLWAAVTDTQERWRLLHGGRKDIRTPFLVAATLDVIYQIIEHKFVYPLELLFTATLLALVPYLILRGPVNRIARPFMTSSGAVKTADKSPAQIKKTGN